MIRVFLFSFVLLPNLIQAQVAFNFESQSAIGSSAADVGSHLVKDSQGNLIIFGTAGDNIDVQPGAGSVTLNPLGNPDAILVKYSETGAVVWALNFGRIALSNGIQARDVAVDSEDNIYISGAFQSNVNFNPLGASDIQSSAGSDDAFVAKYSPDGLLIWFNQIGGLSADAAGVMALSDDRLYVAIRYTGSVDLDPGANTVTTDPIGALDMAIVAFDFDGVYQNSTGASTDGNDDFTAIAWNAGVLAAGAIIDGAVAGLPERSMAMYLFDSDLSAYFSYNFDNQAVSNEITTISFSGDGQSFYVGGRIFGSTDFDPSADAEFIIDPLFADPFFAKYSLDGAFEYAKYIRCSGTEDYLSSAAEAGSLLIVAGSFDISATFIPGDLSTQVNSAGGQDVYLAAYSASNGIFLGSGVFGGAGTEFLRDAIFGTENDLTVVGSFTSSLALNDMGSPIAAIGSSDIFMANFNYDIFVSVDERGKNVFKITPNPVVDHASIQLEGASTGDVQVSVFTVSGQLAFRQTFAVSSSNLQFSLRNIPAGLYLMEVSDGQKMFRQKFVKLSF